MRTAFIQTLEGLAKKNSNIVLLNGDLGFSVLEHFTEQFPSRSMNMGVAEANMMGAAAGLALSGKTVFVYSIIPFVTARVYEQIRNDIALQQANVKIIGVGAGLVYGQLGPTHHAIDDLGLMRGLPNMTVFSPADPVEAELVTKAAAAIKGPVYIRIGKKGDELIHTRKPSFRVGRALTLRSGSDITFCVTGSIAVHVLGAARLLEEGGLSVRILSFPTIKPIDAKSILRASRETKMIVTVEEHSVIGGLGSSVAEVLFDSSVMPTKTLRLGVRDRFTTRAGSHEDLRAFHQLQAEHIARHVLKKFKKQS
ncbi:MAG: transketolase C-terminal domain-containing protein [Patescibacteria group bacterium]